MTDSTLKQQQTGSGLLGMLTGCPLLLLPPPAVVSECWGGCCVPWLWHERPREDLVLAGNCDAHEAVVQNVPFQNPQLAVTSTPRRGPPEAMTHHAVNTRPYLSLG